MRKEEYRDIYQPIEDAEIKYFDEKNTNKLKRLGIKSLYDLFYYFPRAYDDRTNIMKIGDLRGDEYVVLKATLLTVSAPPTRSGLKMVKATATDNTGIIELVWFQMPYLRKTLKVGEEYIFIGQIKRGYVYQLVNPEFKLGSNQQKLEAGEILPIYSTSKEMPQNTLRKLMKEAVKSKLYIFQENIPEEILNKPGRLTDEEFKIMKTHSELGAAIIKDMDFPQDHPLVHTAWQICRWHHERWDGNGYPDGLKGEEIPIAAQVVSIVDVYDALTSERCYKKAFDHDTAIKMILDGQCGQFNPILLKCFKELGSSFSKLISKEKDDNEYYHEVQRLSNEILSDKSLPNQIYSQSLVKVMQEKIDFFKSNSGLNSIDYNAVSGQLTILNGKQQTLCKLNNPNFNLFKEFGVNREDAQRIQAFLRQTSVHNKEIFVQIKAKVDNDSQMYKLKLHTLWSPLKKDGYIGIIGYFDIVK